jgi:CheY-like chemotaxis protein
VRLAQVFSNLLNNASKYTEPGGRIWVHAERSGDTVAVSVRDTGIGIPPEHLPRIFEMFSQVAPARERSHSGLGVGLSLVRAFVNLHGGSVEVHSAGFHQGSEFMVRLPVRASSRTAHPGAPETTGLPAPVRRLRVLAVDDKEDNAKSLGLMLDLMGHETRTVTEGPLALASAEEFRPDVILLDIGMPKMNGYEVARRIRKESWGGAMTLIAMTGWGQEEDKRRSQEAGFDLHLVKPVDPWALARLLQTLPRQRSGGERPDPRLELAGEKEA